MPIGCLYPYRDALGAPRTAPMHSVRIPVLDVALNDLIVGTGTGALLALLLHVLTDMTFWMALLIMEPAILALGCVIHEAMGIDTRVHVCLWGSPSARYQRAHAQEEVSTVNPAADPSAPAAAAEAEAA